MSSRLPVPWSRSDHLLRLDREALPRHDAQAKHLRRRRQCGSPAAISLGAIVAWWL
jgi:hypothetical protein